MPHFHVSSTKNRESIARHGLDWGRMGAAPGIAGSTRPEAAGCFLTTDGLDEADYFVEMNNTGGPVDVWEVHGVASEDLVESPHGYSYFPDRIPADQVVLRRCGADEQGSRRRNKPRRTEPPSASAPGRT